MKRLLIITALIIGTAIYMFSAAWAYDRMSLYIEPASQTEVRQQVKGGRTLSDNMSFYWSSKATLDNVLYDKNVGTAETGNYCFALSKRNNTVSDI